jgi:hypothetical protein
LAQASSAPAAPAPSVVPGPASGTGRSALRRSPPPLMREERRSPPSDLPPSLQLLRREAAKKRESRRFSKQTLLNWPTRFEARTTKPYAPRLVSSLVESEPGHVFIRPPACGRWGVPRQFRVEPRTRTQSPPALPLLPTPLLSLSLPSFTPRGERRREMREREREASGDCKAKAPQPGSLPPSEGAPTATLDGQSTTTHTDAGRGGRPPPEATATQRDPAGLSKPRPLPHKRTREPTPTPQANRPTPCSPP